MNLSQKIVVIITACVIALLVLLHIVNTVQLQGRWGGYTRHEFLEPVQLLLVVFGVAVLGGAITYFLRKKK